MQKVDWNKWSAISEILSAAAIVMTLLYLAAQTRYLADQTEQSIRQTEQTNLLMRSQTRSEIAQSITDMLLRVSFSDNFPALSPDQNLDEIDFTDRVRFQNFQNANFRIWENIHYQYRNGLYEPSEFDKEIEIWRENLGRPTVRAIWCSYRHAYSDQFAATMDSLLEQPC